MERSPRTPKTTLPRHLFLLAPALCVLAAAAPPVDPPGIGSSPQDDAEGERKAGLLDGAWTFRDAEGRDVVEARFRRGKAQGLLKLLRPDGDLWVKARYKAGLPSGEWEFRDAEGDVRDAWSGSYTLHREQWPGGTRRAAGLLRNGRPMGRWTWTWPDGSPWVTGWFEDGLAVGSWQHRHLDGTTDPAWLAAPFVHASDPDELQDLPWQLLVEDLSFAEGQVPPHRALLEDPAPNHEPRPMDPDLLDELHTWSFGHEDLVPGLFGAEPLADLVRALALVDPAEDPGGALDLWRKELDGLLLGAALVPGFSAELLEQGGPAPDATALALGRTRLVSLFAAVGADGAFWDLALPLQAARGEALARCMSQPPRVVVPAVPAPAFALRGAPLPKRLSKPEAARAEMLEDGLTWLVEAQRPDGSWAAGQTQHDLGVTALGLLALLGDGNSLTSGLHRGAVLRAAAWVARHQDPKTGQIRWQKPLFEAIYDHLLSSLALAELQAMSPTPELHTALVRATTWTLKEQKPYSGWGYFAKDDKVDTSITTWAMQALVAAGLAGVDEREGVDLEAGLRGGIELLDEFTDRDTHRVGYNDVGTRSARITDVNSHLTAEFTEALTGAGAYSRLLVEGLAGRTTWRKDVRVIDDHGDILRKALPSWEPGRCVDYYYYYYGSQAAAQMGGALREAWDEAILKTARGGQQADGHWPPEGPWCFAGGKAYATAMMCLALEAPRRYDLGLAEE